MDRNTQFDEFGWRDTSPKPVRPRGPALLQDEFEGELSVREGGWRERVVEELHPTYQRKDVLVGTGVPTPGDDAMIGDLSGGVQEDRDLG